MKKNIYSILIALFILLPVSVLAEGYISVSPSSITVEKGSSKTFTITAYNTIGDVSISSNNSGVASVSTGEWGTGMVDEKQTKTGTITVNGVGVGTAAITLTMDAATFDLEDLAGQTKSITVNVIEKQNQTPSQTPTNIPNNPNNNSNNINNNNLSQNNKIKSLSVDGYELLKLDDNNYILDVANDITDIKVNAEAEDSKSKITGIGIHELNVGENNIEIIVTSEAGTQNKINLKVNRKDAYYLEDFEYLVNKKEQEQIDISINYDTNITEEQIDKIKKNNKVVNLNYYDENKKLVYSWSLDGRQMKDVQEFETSLSFMTDNQKEIYKLSNYADGLYINFKHNGILPAGTKIKLFVGDKFENGSFVNVYHYDNEKQALVFIEDDLKVTDGYIEFDIKHCSDYFITMSKIATQAKESTIFKEKKSSNNVFIIVGVIVFILLITFIILYYLKKKSAKKETVQTTNINNNLFQESLVNTENQNTNIPVKNTVNEIVDNNLIENKAILNNEYDSINLNDGLIYNKFSESREIIPESSFNNVNENNIIDGMLLNNTDLESKSTFENIYSSIEENINYEEKNTFNNLQNNNIEKETLFNDNEEEKKIEYKSNNLNIDDYLNNNSIFNNEYKNNNISSETQITRQIENENTAYMDDEENIHLNIDLFNDRN